MANTLLLKTIVGSQAHGLATDASDTDYRGVFVTPTRQLLALGNRPNQTSWIEGKDDDTSFEIGHFLHLATKCNPTILEVFLAPQVDGRFPWCQELRDLFPHLWHSRGVCDAFIGYGLNQRKKFLESRDRRADKFAVAYLRTLYQAWELLRTKTFTVRIADTEVGDILRKWKRGEYTIGEVMQTCSDWQESVNEELETGDGYHEANLAPVNDFLLRVRKKFWS